MGMGDDIRERFIRRGSVIGGVACAALTVTDLVRGDAEGLFWNAWYFGTVVIALALFHLTRSRLIWALTVVQAPLAHLSFASGDSAILAYFWVYPFPILAFFVLGLRRGAVVALSLWASAAGVMLFRADALGLNETTPDVVASLGVVTLVSLAYEYLRDKYERQLRESLVTDELTGVPNRRYFNTALKEELVRAARYDRPLSLVLFDLDDFKGVNDERGHPAGDAVLVELANVVGEQLRASDRFARLGGDEFAIIAPETPNDGDEGTFEVVNLAERIRESVAQHDFAVGRNLTVSLGATERIDGDDPASIVQRADDALYLAKARGRNCVAVKDGGTTTKDRPIYLDRRSAIAPAE